MQINRRATPLSAAPGILYTQTQKRYFRAIRLVSTCCAAVMQDHPSPRVINPESFPHGS
jgi:hypothetical protein